MWWKINSGKNSLLYAVNSAWVNFTKTLICNISGLDWDTEMVNTILNLAWQGLLVVDKIFENCTMKFYVTCTQMHFKSSKLFSWPILGKILWRPGIENYSKNCLGILIFNISTECDKILVKKFQHLQ